MRCIGPWGGTQRGGIPRGKGEAFTGGGPSQGNIATHVEGHACAVMHQRNIMRATLLIQERPCKVCDNNIKSALPPGAELTIVDPETTQIYRSSQLPGFGAVPAASATPTKTEPLTTQQTEPTSASPPKQTTSQLPKGSIFETTPLPAELETQPSAPASTASVSKADVEQKPAKVASPEAHPPQQVTPKSVDIPAKPGSTTAKGFPDMPRKGSQTVERVTVEYDFSGSETKDAVKLKAIDLSDYPPNKESKITRFFKDRPLVKQLTSMGATAAAGQLSNEMLEKVQSHFESAIEQASKNFEKEFPTAEELLLDADIYEKEQTYKSVMAWLEEDDDLALGIENVESNLEGAFAYEKALLDLYMRIHQYRSELPAIYDDINKRADILLRIARNLEQAFEWIHTHLVGAYLPVYYESFTLWSVRGTFNELGLQLSSFAGTINSREHEYEELTGRLGLTEERGQLKLTQLDLWRGFYEENQHLLGTK